MVYFLRRGDEAITYETRLRQDGPGYELVIAQNGQAHVEPFESLAQLLAREHELLHAWRAQGWRDVQQTQPKAPAHAGMPGPSHSPDRCPRCGEAVVRSDATVTGAPRWACGHCYHVWDAARTEGDRRTGPRERRRVTRRDRRKPSR